MFILNPLRTRTIRLLWGGQVLSAIGDEVYKVALIWLAIRLSGKDAGFLAAVEAGAILTFGLLGGAWAERWNHRRLMIAVDLVRAAAVLSLPIFAYFHPLSLPILIAIAIVVSSLSAFFDPAMQMTLPEIASEENGLLQASNGLMEATRRLARILGPAMVGAMNSFVPLIHFFTIDAVSFLLSAASLWTLGRMAPSQAAPAKQGAPLSPWQTIKYAFALTDQNPVLKAVILSCSLTWSLWSLCFTLGLALLVNERSPGNLTAYGLLISAYGVGNLTSNLIWGSLQIRRPQLTTFIGTGIIGLGFIGVALAPTFPLQMLATAFCAMGGPMEDLSFLAILQRHYRGSDIARIFRLRMSLAFGGIFLVFLASPALFRIFKVTTVIGACGIGLTLVASFGVWHFGLSKHNASGEHDRWQNRDLIPKRSNG